MSRHYAHVSCRCENLDVHDSDDVNENVNQDPPSLRTSRTLILTLTSRCCCSVCRLSAASCYSCYCCCFSWSDLHACRPCRHRVVCLCLSCSFWRTRRDGSSTGGGGVTCPSSGRACRLRSSNRPSPSLSHDVASTSSLKTTRLKDAICSRYHPCECCCCSCVSASCSTSSPHPHSRYRHCRSCGGVSSDLSSPSPACSSSSSCLSCPSSLSSPSSPSSWSWL